MRKPSREALIPFPMHWLVVYYSFKYQGGSQFSPWADLVQVVYDWCHDVWGYAEGGGTAGFHRVQDDLRRGADNQTVVKLEKDRLEAGVQFHRHVEPVQVGEDGNNHRNSPHEHWCNLLKILHSLHSKHCKSWQSFQDSHWFSFSYGFQGSSF